MDDERHRAAELAAQGAVFATWLTAVFALAGYAGGDRYPGYFLVWTGLLLAAGLALPLALFGVLARRLRRLPSPAALAAAYCVVFAACLSLDVGPPLGMGTRLGATQLLLLVGCLALAAWNLARGRRAPLSLGAAMGVLALSWLACGLLRADGAPKSLARASILLPLAAACAVQLAGRLGSTLS